MSPAQFAWCPLCNRLRRFWFLLPSYTWPQCVGVSNPRNASRSSIEKRDRYQSFMNKMSKSAHCVKDCQAARLAADMGKSHWLLYAENFLELWMDLPGSCDFYVPWETWRPSVAKGTLCPLKFSIGSMVLCIAGSLDKKTRYAVKFWNKCSLYWSSAAAPSMCWQKL